ncbi:hypothetical protein F5Y19DRAFT_471386 [Xylariaceae sp. FL1651]|nr:hypothetical protein F5Y19DRAFT_471386 [Xylariaceae sp. FL1651]
MATRHDLGGAPKRKLTTYGRVVRKRQPKTVFTPVTVSESMSEEDPIIASDTTMARRQPILVPSPKPDSPSARFKSLDGTRDSRTKPTSFQHIASSDRKRKISQVYPSKERTQTLASESEEESSPSAPETRRSRITAPDSESATTSTFKGRVGIQSSLADSMDIDPVAPRLSSPPPTPTRPKVSTSSTKPSSYTTKKKYTNAPQAKSAPKLNVPQQHRIPLHLARDSSQKVRHSNAPLVVISKEQGQSASKSSSLASPLSKKPRKRLIDALVEQVPSDAIELSEDVPDSLFNPGQTNLSQTADVSVLHDQSLPATPKSKARGAPATGVRTFTRSSSALKFTYGQGRRVLEEEDNLLESLALPEESYSLKGRRLELGGPKKSVAAMGTFDDDDTAVHDSPSSKLRDIHELRQAGANSRVADAMQDLIDQMGKPGINSSSRRTALLQVAEKMRDKTFIRQCRDHGVESILLREIGKESDIICGYLILSSLVTIIAKGTSSHIGRLLRLEEAGPIFARLLSIRDDIKKLAKDRKSNLSKRNQTSVISIESSLRELPIWDGHQPSFISPRCLAIKSLQLLIAQDVLVGRDPTIFTGAVTEHLFEVLSDASKDIEYWTYPTTARSIELCGALSVLDFHVVSVTATQDGNSDWVAKYLPIIADALHTSLQTPADNSKIVNDLILKLTINVTNNNLDAPSIFASKGFLPALAASISCSFSQALALISQNSWTEGIIDSLVLRLGILINFAEHSGLVRQIVNDCQYDSQEPANELIRLYIENHRRTGEADSMEKTHLNVAFGYLSVLLGYLALHAPVRHKLKSSHPARSVGPLIDSIREFIAHYEQVDNIMSEGDDGARNHSGYTGRLQELVQQLEDKAAYD